MSKEKAPKKAENQKTMVISFRIAESLYKTLESKAKDHADESGLPLTPSGMARRLVIEAIKGKNKN